MPLEELNIPYQVHPINLMQGEQKTDALLAMNPNGRAQKRPVRTRPGTTRKTKLIRMSAPHPFPPIQVSKLQSQFRKCNPALADILACAAAVTGFAWLVGLSVLAEEHRTDVSALPLSKSKGSQPNAGGTVLNCDGCGLGVSQFDRVQPRGSRTRSYR